MFWENFVELCAEKEKSPTRVIEELGLARSAVTKWKNGVTPSKTSLKKMSEYFGVDPQRLFGARSESSDGYKRFEEATAGFTDQQLDELIAYAQFIRARDKK